MTDIKSMNLTEMAAYFKELGEPAFRAKQVFQWLHRGVFSFDEMTNLSKPLREKLAGRGFFLSSANSINWGRVLPQIVYYISAYCDLLREGRIQKGERINVCVPTGNFGNILAAYYAREMGVPIGRLICASNSNNVLTDFLCTGVYDRNRTFYNTMSPSMDILISSNLERLLFSLSNHDDAEARGYMEELARSGRYEVSPAIKAGEAFRRRFLRRRSDTEGHRPHVAGAPLPDRSPPRRGL